VARAASFGSLRGGTLPSLGHSASSRPLSCLPFFSRRHLDFTPGLVLRWRFVPTSCLASLDVLHGVLHSEAHKNGFQKNGYEYVDSSSLDERHKPIWIWGTLIASWVSTPISFILSSSSRSIRLGPQTMALDEVPTPVRRLRILKAIKTNAVHRREE
jgi:hypothetical protein